ncbi:hypothetical protein [Tychonema sp. LEGE 07203]|uniref:hypothetical protein n=1 Tax=Tychonema sp. LEGE 07203 TaxID=1828671 RepID=UPI00187F6D26|nr:hypothetical protein [Tychonema sp. LEGE 07203]MBE9093523.1 hypothetical protein [Tychonema sp. LEGE 07203]
MYRERHASLATVSVTVASSPAIPSLFQQSPALQAFMFLQAIDDPGDRSNKLLKTGNHNVKIT